MIEAVMFWNEPNNKSHWDFQLDPDWRSFAAMVKLAAQAIAQENSRLLRVLGGISPIDPHFIRNMDAQGERKGGAAMPSRVKITTDHGEIRRWVQERGGHPAAVKRTRGKPGEPAILRIDFPGFSGAQSLEQISWEEFFDKFDEQNLAFLCQETTARGLRSNFNKLIKRPAQKKQTGGTAATSADRTTRRRARAASEAKGTRKSAGTTEASGKQGGRRKTAR